MNCGSRCRLAAYRKRKRRLKRKRRVRVKTHRDPIAALCRWRRRKLVTPQGHPHSGEPMEIPAYRVNFLRDALRNRKSLLCMARKNAKPALFAVFAMGRLVGPIRFDGWRSGVSSINFGEGERTQTPVRGNRHGFVPGGTGLPVLPDSEAYETQNSHTPQTYRIGRLQRQRENSGSVSTSQEEKLIQPSPAGLLFGGHLPGMTYSTLQTHPQDQCHGMGNRSAYLSQRQTRRLFNSS